MNFILQGLLLGLAYTAPIGMQNMFVINAAASSPLKKSLMTAFIVIFFDISLSLACFFGIGRLMHLFPLLEGAILGIGSLLVMYIGIGLLRSRAEMKADIKTHSLRKTIADACIVTWANPQAILDGTMLLGAFQAAMSGSDALYFMAGVMAASCLWFTGLTLFIALFRSRFTPGMLLLINRICGVVILAYGGRLFYHWIQLFM